MKIGETVFVIYVMHYLSSDCLIFPKIPKGSERLGSNKTYQQIIRLLLIKETMCKALNCSDRGKNETLTRKIYPDLRKRIEAEPSELTNDSHCMKFSIQPANIHRAVLYIHIKKIHKKNKKNRKGKRRHRSITIFVYKLSQDKSKNEIKKMRFRPHKTKYYPLPLLSGRGLQESKQKSLHLCLKCQKCNRKTSITFPTKKKNKSKRKKKKKKRKSVRILKLRKNRPYLMLKKMKSFRNRKRSRRHLQSCSSSRDNNTCCVARTFIAFKELGLGGDISHPKGFYKTYCAKKCERNSVLHHSFNKSVQTSFNCTPSYYEDLNLRVTVENITQNILIPNGNIRHCSCERIDL